jgi:hypothetical protein
VLGTFLKKVQLFLCVVTELDSNVTAPHSNQFLDPLLLIKNVRRRVDFLCAQKSFERKFIGPCVRAMDASKLCFIFIKSPRHSTSRHD